MTTTYHHSEKPLRFSVPFVKSKERPRVYNNRTITPKATKASEDEIAMLFRMAKIQQNRYDLTLDKRYRVSLFAPYVRRKVDLDNQLKTVMDALNGELYKDDTQVDCLHAERVPGQEGFVIEVAAFYPVEELQK